LVRTARRRATSAFFKGGAFFLGGLFVDVFFSLYGLFLGMLFPIRPQENEDRR